MWPAGKVSELVIGRDARDVLGYLRMIWPSQLRWCSLPGADRRSGAPAEARLRRPSRLRCSRRPLAGDPRVTAMTIEPLLAEIAFFVSSQLRPTIAAHSLPPPWPHCRTCHVDGCGWSPTGQGADVDPWTCCSAAAMHIDGEAAAFGDRGYRWGRLRPLRIAPAAAGRPSWWSGGRGPSSGSAR